MSGGQAIFDGYGTLAAFKNALKIPWSKDIFVASTGALVVGTNTYFMSGPNTATSGLELESVGGSTAIVPTGVYVCIGSVTGAANSPTSPVTWWQTNHTTGNEIMTATSGVLVNTTGADWKSNALLNSITSVAVGTKMSLSFSMTSGIMAVTNLTTVNVRLCGYLVF